MAHLHCPAIHDGWLPDSAWQQLQRIIRRIQVLDAQMARREQSLDHRGSE
jgi:hypothetical protein